MSKDSYLPYCIMLQAPKKKAAPKKKTATKKKPATKKKAAPKKKAVSGCTNFVEYWLHYSFLLQ